MLLLQHRAEPGTARRTLALLLLYIALYVILIPLTGV